MFALVDANSFYASCERVFRPDLHARPIVVLSNNDGCVIARSQEAKNLQIEMGAPYFQIRKLLQEHEVAVFSSNYTLYNDMSQRVQNILRMYADCLEVYSIDESFLYWSADLDWKQLGRDIIARVRQWTGLTVGVGIGPTKTLSKVANHLAKRGVGATGLHILDCDAAIDAALRAIELSNIWGISRGLIRQLGLLGIKTPIQLRDADPAKVRKQLGVVGQRIVYELRGIRCIPLEMCPPDKQNICCSRSFGQVTNAFETVREAVCTFAQQAAVKMRRQQLVTGRIGVFLQTDRHADVVQYAASWAVTLAEQTYDTRVLCRAASWCLSKVFKKEHCYKKAGVMVFDLCKNTQGQQGLFPPTDREKSQRLMKTIDAINRDHGRNTIRVGSSSPFTLSACRTWHLRCDYRSPRYTTSWDDLPTANASP